MKIPLDMGDFLLTIRCRNIERQPPAQDQPAAGFVFLEHPMAKLSTEARKRLPKSAFGLPGSRGFPMPDPSHAANAKARATQAVKAGRMAPTTAAKIKAKANKILGKKGK